MNNNVIQDVFDEVLSNKNLLITIAKRKPIENSIYPYLTDKGIVYRVQVGVTWRENGKQHCKTHCATCDTLEEARMKRDEFRKLQKRNGAEARVETLEKRIAELEKEIAKLKEEE